MTWEMFSPDAFEAAIRELARLNHLDLETAGDYMVRIGDTPELAADGRIIVRDDTGKEIARVLGRRTTRDPG